MGLTIFTNNSNNNNNNRELFFSMYEDNIIPTIINVAGLWTPVVEGNPNLSPLNDSSFFINDNGFYQYTGGTEINVMITATATVFRGSGGGADGYEYTLFKNGTKIPNLKTGFITQNGGSNLRLHSSPLVYIDTIANGDIYKPYIRSITSTDNVEVRNAQINFLKI